MKKIISIVISAMMIFSVCIVGSAESAVTNRYDSSVSALSEFDEGNPGGEEPGGEEPGGEEPGGEEEPEPQYAPDTVALMYLCTNWTGFPSLGHIWIYIENVSDEQLRVGVYDLPAGEGVSIGTFGLTRSDGGGVYYNIEAYTGNLLGMDDSFCIKTEMNADEFNKVSRKVLRSNFWDPIAFNCAFFAISCWNLAGGSFVFPVVVFPVIARLQMRIKGVEPLKMFYPERERVYKQKGSGSSAYVVPASDGSVDTPPG